MVAGHSSVRPGVWRHSLRARRTDRSGTGAVPSGDDWGVPTSCKVVPTGETHWTPILGQYPYASLAHPSPSQTSTPRPGVPRQVFHILARISLMAAPSSGAVIHCNHAPTTTIPNKPHPPPFHSTVTPIHTTHAPLSSSCCGIVHPHPSS